MTTTDHTALERDIRQALNAAADRITVDTAADHGTDVPFAAVTLAGPDEPRPAPNRQHNGPTARRGSPGRQGSRRWVLPAVAAAAVLAVVAAAFLVTKDRVSQRDLTLATTLVQDAGTADLGGIRFPVPDGWTASITENTPTYVRVCVAQSPSTGCDGVTLTAALPGGPPLGNTEPLTCKPGQPTYLVRSDRSDFLAGRPGWHLYGWCGSNGGPVAHQWLLLDQGLEIRTPVGRYENQGYQIAEGLDLSNWIRSPGEQQIFGTMATQSGGVDRQLSEKNGIYSIFGARFPVPDGWESLLTGPDLAFDQICLARTPTPDCHGVTVRLALPNAPLVEAAPTLDCPRTPDVFLDKDISSLGGRPAEHLTVRCAATGDRRQVWQLTDSSLQIWADAEFEQQGALVVDGLNLDDWQRPPADSTAAAGDVPAGTSAAPTSSESGKPSPTATPVATVTSSIPAVQPTVP